MKDQERSRIVRTFSALAAGILLSAAIAVPAMHPQAAQAAAAHKPSPSPTPTPTPSPPPKNHSPFCNKLANKTLGASQGAQMFCFGAQSANAAQAGVNGSASASTSFGSNVDAANPQEDVTPSGVQVHGHRRMREVLHRLMSRSEARLAHGEFLRPLIEFGIERVRSLRNI